MDFSCRQKYFSNFIITTRTVSHAWLKLSKIVNDKRRTFIFFNAIRVSQIILFPLLSNDKITVHFDKWKIPIIRRSIKIIWLTFDRLSTGYEKLIFLSQDYWNSQLIEYVQFFFLIKTIFDRMFASKISKFWFQKKREDQQILLNYPLPRSKARAQNSFGPAAGRNRIAPGVPISLPEIGRVRAANSPSATLHWSLHLWNVWICAGGDEGGRIRPFLLVKFVLSGEGGREIERFSEKLSGDGYFATGWSDKRAFLRTT